MISTGGFPRQSPDAPYPSGCQPGAPAVDSPNPPAPTVCPSSPLPVTPPPCDGSGEVRGSWKAHGTPNYPYSFSSPAPKFSPQSRALGTQLFPTPVPDPAPGEQGGNPIPTPMPHHPGDGGSQDTAGCRGPSGGTLLLQLGSSHSAAPRPSCRGSNPCTRSHPPGCPTLLFRWIFLIIGIL